jgi:hypothetical protein
LGVTPAASIGSSITTTSSSSSGSSDNALSARSSSTSGFGSRALGLAAPAAAGAAAAQGWGLTWRSRTSPVAKLRQAASNPAATAGPVGGSNAATASSRGAPVRTAATSGSSSSSSLGGLTSSSSSSSASTAGGSSRRGDAMKTAATALTSQLPAESAAAGGKVHMLTVVKEGLTSPYKGADWERVLRHMAQRLEWTDERFIMTVVTTAQLQVNGSSRPGTKGVGSSRGGTKVGGSSRGGGEQGQDPHLRQMEDART